MVKMGSNRHLRNLYGDFSWIPKQNIQKGYGCFWIGFITKRNDQLDDIHPKKGMKKFVYGLPSFVQPKAE